MVCGRPAEILLINPAADGAGPVREALKSGKCNARLHVAGNSTDALDYLFRRGHHKSAPRPDLILLDLPGKNAKDVLAETKADSGLCDIPVIMLTRATNPQDAIEAWDLHANCTIDKPENGEDYASMLGTVLEFWLNVVRLPSGVH